MLGKGPHCPEITENNKEGVMKRSKRISLSTLLCLIPALVTTSALADDHKIRHVLVISIDGMHALDFALWTKSNPVSALANLAARGVNYTNATTNKPSDSILATVGIFSGGWAAVLPHDMMRLNTVFEVVRSVGGLTAYSEKRPSYDFLNGPSGRGVQDLYTPEIACFPFTPPSGCNNALLSIAATEAFDELRVKSVLNEIDGKDHSGKFAVGTPMLFGMNFQAVNAAKKDSLLPIVGGYADDLSTPNADLHNALQYVDGAIGRMVAELAAQGLTDTTAIIITAKHCETPLDPSKRFVESTSAIQKQPSLSLPGIIPAPPAAMPAIPKLTEKSTAYIWLKDQSMTDTIAGVLTTKTNESVLNIAQILSGESLKLLFPDPLTDPAPPDIVVVPNPGTNYEPATQVLAEHGGFNENDTHVPLLLVGGAAVSPGVVRALVTTTQIAPTILELLSLDTTSLQSVRLEDVKVLTGVKGDNGKSAH